MSGCSHVYHPSLNRCSECGAKYMGDYGPPMVKSDALAADLLAAAEDYARRVKQILEYYDCDSPAMKAERAWLKEKLDA